MTVQEEVRQRIERDPLLAKLRQKIESGKASYTDTAAYSIRAGKLLGEIFSRRLPDIPLEEREPLCVELLHGRYVDINAAVDAVQRFMDEAQGLHLAPQHAPFDSERGHQIGSSLRDLSKPVETLQRRARAATETMTKAMHDDRMKAEARFRSRAGLDCRIVRVAVGGCCEWCSKVAGRYAYGEEPDGIYRRHDNCDCTVTFENGRKRQDVWSKREWEVPEPGAGAEEPVRFTLEQARKLEAKKMPKRLTPAVQSGTMVVGENGLTVNSRQFGKKVGKHAIDFGLNPKDDQARQQVLDIIVDIRDNPDMVVDGRWRGQGTPKANGSGNEDGDVTFYIKGTSVLVCNQNEFVTVMRDAINSGRVQEAIKKQRSEE